MWLSNCMGCLHVPTPVHGCWSRQHDKSSGQSKFQTGDQDTIAHVLQGELSSSLLRTDSVVNRYFFKLKEENKYNLPFGVGFSKQKETAVCPVQTLVALGVQNYTASSPVLLLNGSEQKSSYSSQDSSLSTPLTLKFGINKILSEDFGKNATGQGKI